MGQFAIAMPRRDFEKLYKIIKKQYSFKYSMLHPQDKENYGRILPKIRLIVWVLYGNMF